MGESIIQLQPTRLLRPWDFPGKSTGVGCHCLLTEPNMRLHPRPHLLLEAPPPDTVALGVRIPTQESGGHRHLDHGLRFRHDDNFAGRTLSLKSGRGPLSQRPLGQGAGWWPTPTAQAGDSTTEGRDWTDFSPTGWAALPVHLCPGEPRSPQFLTRAPCPRVLRLCESPYQRGGVN